MTVTKRGYTAASNILAGGTVACPAGVQAGDLMFMFCATTSTLLETNKTPDGWVELLGLRHAENVPTTGDVGVRTFVRSAGASEPATYTTGFDSAVWIGIYVLYSSTGAGLKIDVTGSYAETVTTGTHVIPSITMSAAGMRLDFVMYSTQFSASNPTGSVEEQDATMGSQRYQLFTESVSSGATGTRTTSTTSNLNRVKASSIGVIEGAYVQQLGPQFRSVTGLSPNTTSTTTNTMVAPANMQVGDLLMAQITVQAGASVPSITGWTTLVSTAGSFPLTYIFYKTAVAGDIGATLTFNWSNTTTRTYTYFYAAIFSPNGYTLIVDTSSTGAYAAGATVIDFPSVTTTYANELLILISANNSTITARNGHKDSELHLHTSSSKSSFWSSYQPSAGATTAYQMTQSATASNERNSTIAIYEILAPSDPSGLTATPTSATAITVTWVDNSTSEANFELEHSTNGSTWALLTSPAANATTYNHTGLSEHTIHYYRIRAYNAAGYSGYSNTGSTYTDLIAPSGLSATVVSNSQINLAWTDNSGAESGYKVEQSANGTTGWSVINTTAAGATSYSVTGLSQNTIYYFRVRAYNGSEFSAYTSVANATTLPTAPSDLAAAAASTTQINLTWTDSGKRRDGLQA
jgi:hypothetical protein